MSSDRPTSLVIACGALARELVELLRSGPFEHVDVVCLPADLHNRPERIADRVRERIRAARPFYGRILVGYADCGTGGQLDRVCAEEGVTRLPGAHCYELYAQRHVFAALHERDPATFYVTDYLVRNFDRLVVAGLGIDRHPELEPLYFGNYRRLVHLAQTDDAGLADAGRRAAARLGLEHERRLTGTGDLGAAVTAFARPTPAVADVSA